MPNAQETVTTRAVRAVMQRVMSGRRYRMWYAASALRVDRDRLVITVITPAMKAFIDREHVEDLDEVCRETGLRTWRIMLPAEAPAELF